jgi:hypothetical protein
MFLNKLILLQAFKEKLSIRFPENPTDSNFGHSTR